MVELGKDLERSRGNDLGRVPLSFHGQVFSGYCETSEG